MYYVDEDLVFHLGSQNIVQWILRSHTTSMILISDTEGTIFYFILIVFIIKPM